MKMIYRIKLEIVFLKKRCIFELTHKKTFYMRKLFVLIILFLSITTVLTAQEIAGSIQVDIHSQILNQNRTVLIYTPQLYNERDLVAYDVIYVMDAQNREMFDLVHSLVRFSTQRQFIVVGITSTAFPEQYYYRNDDLLPKPKNVSIDHYLALHPNAENFRNYLLSEVIPYVENHFRTTQRRILIGHSLSASFVVDRALNDASMFEGCIAISPNFCYDSYRLANDFISHDFASTTPHFLYISESNELNTFRKSWNIGYQKVKSFINNRDTIGNYLIYNTEYPEHSHWTTYPPSLTNAIEQLDTYLETHPLQISGPVESIVIKVMVPNDTDDVYIVGNQAAFGNWDPSIVKFKSVAPKERILKVDVQYPLEFKLTKGSWDTEAFLLQSSNTLDNIIIQSVKNDTLILKVEDWIEQ